MPFDDELVDWDIRIETPPERPSETVDLEFEVDLMVQEYFSQADKEGQPALRRRRTDAELDAMVELIRRT